MSQKKKRKSPTWRMIKFGFIRRVLLPVATPLIRHLWIRTWRVEVETPEEFEDFFFTEKPTVLGEFHGDFLILVALIEHIRRQGRTFRSVSIVSPSRDGRLLADTIHRWGQATVEGSSARGGAKALLEMRREMREGFIGNFAVDGPRGPRGVPNLGAFLLAKSTKARLFMMTAGSQPAIRFNSWDRAQLPLPFARIKVRYRMYKDYAVDSFEETDPATFQRALLEESRKLGQPVDDIELMPLDGA